MSDKETSLTHGDTIGDSTESRTASAVAPTAYIEGPWHVDGADADLRVRSRSCCIALVTGGFDQDLEADQPIRMANARLIAAAPELLTACRNYIAWVDRSETRECIAAIGEQVRDAIAKAEGR